MALTCLLTDLTNHFPLSVGASGAAPRDPISPTISRHVRSDRDVRVVSVALDRLRLKYEQADRDAVDEMVAIKMPSLDVIDLVHAATEHVQRD